MERQLKKLITLNNLELKTNTTLMHQKGNTSRIISQ